MLFPHQCALHQHVRQHPDNSEHQHPAVPGRSLPPAGQLVEKEETGGFRGVFADWTAVLTICLTFNKENQPDKLWTCYERCKNQPLQLEFFLTLQLIGFAAPLLIIIVCSTCIIYTLSKAEEKSEEKRSTVGIVTANMLVFIVCYTPFHIGLIANYLLTSPPDWKSEYLPAHEYLLVSEWITSTNCCFDCIGYYFLLRHVYL